MTRRLHDDDRAVRQPSRAGIKRSRRSLRSDDRAVPQPSRTGIKRSRRSLRSDDRAVMQVVEAMLALSILILAIGWAVNVSQRPSEAPVESDELRSLTRQALELMDANDSAGAEPDTVQEFLEDPACGDGLATTLIEILGDARLNLFLSDGTTEQWIGSGYATGTGTVAVPSSPLPTGTETSVVRYLAERHPDDATDPCDEGLPTGIVSLRIEVWHS